MRLANESSKPVSVFKGKKLISFQVVSLGRGNGYTTSTKCLYYGNHDDIELRVNALIFFLSRLLVTVAAMAIPSVPSASIMTTIMILTSMNIPVEDIALLLAVEWYL